MGVIDDKKDIFIDTSSLISLKENNIEADTSNSLPSVNNSDEVLPFLLDLLTVLVGSVALTSLLGNVFSKFIKEVQPQLKTELKKQFTQYNASTSINDTTFKNGFEMPVKNIDVYGKLKTDPNSDIGSILYNSEVNDFDNKAYESIINPNSDIGYSNIDINYSDVNDTMKITPTNTNQTVGNFMEGYIDELNIVNEREFTTNVVDDIFGTKTTNQDKNFELVFLEQKIASLLEKFVDNANVELSDKELNELQDKAKSLVAGVSLIDLGCGYLPSSLELDDLTSLVNSISGSTDPYFIGSSFNSLIDSGYAAPTETTALKNDDTIKDNFNKLILKNIQKQLLNIVVLTPQMRVLFGISEGLKNNGNINNSDIANDLEKNEVMIKCLTNSTNGLLNEFVFNTVKKEMEELIIPVSKKIITEKINQYVGILKSLVGV